MKKILLILFLLLFVQSALAVETVFKNEEVRIDLNKIDPSPIKPGEIFDIWFDITNVEAYTLRNVEFTISTKFPFSINEGLDTVKIAELKPGEIHSIKYNIKTNANADEGTYDLGLQYLSPKIGSIVSAKFSLDIVKSKTISATNIKVDPERVRQGERATITFTLENTADSALKDVKVKLDLSGDLPFAPIGATTENDVALLAKGQRTDVVFNIIALPDAKSGIYKLPLDITYYDESGKEYNKQNIFGVMIGSEPDLSFYIDSTTLYKGSGNVGTINIKIVNKGLSDVKFLNLNLEDTNYFEVISPGEVYIGNVDSDDYETAEYKVKIKRTKDGGVVFPLKVSYKDATNTEYSEIKEVTLKLRSARDVGVKQSNAGTIFIIIILIALYFYGYRNWKKQNKGGLKGYSLSLYNKTKNWLKRKKIVK